MKYVFFIIFTSFIFMANATDTTKGAKSVEQMFDFDFKGNNYFELFKHIEANGFNLILIDTKSSSQNCTSLAAVPDKVKNHFQSFKIPKFNLKQVTINELIGFLGGALDYHGNFNFNVTTLRSNLIIQFSVEKKHNK